MVSSGQNWMNKRWATKGILKELWFPGVHRDWRRLSGSGWRGLRYTVLVDLDEGDQSGVAGVDPDRLDHVVHKTAPPRATVAGAPARVVDSVLAAVSIFLKLVWCSRISRHVPSMGLGRHRYIPDGCCFTSLRCLRIPRKGWLRRRISRRHSWKRWRTSVSARRAAI